MARRRGCPAALSAPARQALLLAVYQEEIESLGASVDRLLDQKSPLEAFCIWARKLAELVRVKHGLGEALESPAAKAVIDAEDVLLMLSALWRVLSGEEALEQADRLLDMIVDSLATSPR